MAGFDAGDDADRRRDRAGTVIRPALREERRADALREGDAGRAVPALAGGAIAVSPSGAGALREELRSAARDGRARWVRMDGLALDDADTHRALMHSLAPLGVAGEADPRVRLETVVLDWSRVTVAAAEAVAGFSVLLRWLAAGSARRYVVRPGQAGIAAVLPSVCGGELGQTDQISPSAMRGSARVLAAAPEFSAAGHDSIPPFLDHLSAALSELGASADVRGLALGLAQEVISNILVHAGGTRACAVALYHPRRRPPVVQLGVADDGRGIPEAMLDRAAWRGMGALHDTTILDAVVRRGLTRRANGGECAEEDGRGGLSAMIAHALPRLSGVWIRSGAALVWAAGGGRWRRAWLDHGFGSQLRVEVPLTR